MDEDEIALAGEVYLGAWSDSVENSTGTSDAWIKLYLSDSDMLDKIRPSDVRGKAKQGGKRYQAVMVEVGDDEQPVKQESNGAKPSQMAYNFTDLQTDLFSEWLKTDKHFWINAVHGNDPVLWKESSKKLKCKLVLLYACSIESRSELDTDPLAAESFEEIRQQYDAWKQLNANSHARTPSQKQEEGDKEDSLS